MGTTNKSDKNVPIKEWAKRYLKAGLSVIPCNSIKVPTIGSWAQYQKVPPTEDEVELMFDEDDNIAVVGGEVSGGLEVLDFDMKGIFFEPWAKKVKQLDPELYKRLLIETSPSGGYHVPYRCTKSVTDKLARKHYPIPEKDILIEQIVVTKKKVTGTEDKEYAISPSGKKREIKVVDGVKGVIETLIETKGEGGYCLVDPSKGYKVIQGSFKNIPVITIEEREILLEAAKSFDEYERQLAKISKKVQKKTGANNSTLFESSPADDYAKKHSIEDMAELLENHGWSRGAESEEYLNLTRPGKTVQEGNSAGLIKAAPVFHVFSSSADPFEEEESYSYFAVYALLEHDGDQKKAANQLIKEGYGKTVGESIEWSPPLSIETAQESIEFKAHEVMPKVLADFCVDVGYRCGGAPESVWSPLIVALGSVIGNQLVIRPKKNDDWEVFPNFYGVVIDTPSSKKTPLASEGLRFINTLEGEAQEEYKQALEEYRKETAGVEDDLKDAKKNLKQAKKNLKDLEESTGATLKSLVDDGKEIPKEYEVAKTELDDCKQALIELGNADGEPKPKCFLAGDESSAALMVSLEENPNGILYTDDELASIFAQCTQRGNEGMRGIFLKGWSGGEAHRIRRIERGMHFIPMCTLSMFATTQPSTLKKLLVEDAVGGKNNDGFLQRFNMAVWPNKRKAVPVVDKAPDLELINKVMAIFRRLSNLDFLGQTKNNITASFSSKHKGVHYIRYSPKAYAGFMKWLNKNEEVSRSDEYGDALKSHFSKLPKLFAALSLVYHLVMGGKGEVSLTATRYAQRSVRLLKQHVIKIYRLGQADVLEGANLLREKLESGILGSEFKLRDITSKNWKEFRHFSTAQIKDILKVLDSAHIIKVVAEQNSGKRGRKAIVYFVNPDVYAG